MQRYNWNHTFNTRDLGYTPTAGKNSVKPLSINAKVPNSENDVIENYCRMLENDKAIADIFGTMANSAGGILFHCQEGKDRTGVISALLLLLAGVSDVDIYADYEISNIYLYEMIQTAKGILPDHLLYLNTEYIANTLKYLREKYKTVESYLLLKGVSETEIHKFKKQTVGLNEFPLCARQRAINLTGEKPVCLRFDQLSGHGTNLS